MAKSKKMIALDDLGWREISVGELVGLSPEEMAMIDLQLNMAYCLRDRRLKRKWTQVQLAKRLGTSQSRVAKMETGHPSVSLDLLVRGLLATGVTLRELGKIIGARPGRRAA